MASTSSNVSSSNYGFDARGKVIVVTGGTRGIGLGVARAFAVRHGAKRVQRVEKRADGWRSSDGAAVELAVDLSTEDGAKKCARAIEANGDDRVHVLVHNSDVVGAELETHDDRGWDRTHAVERARRVSRLTRELTGAHARGERDGSVESDHHRVHSRYQTSKVPDVFVRREQGGGDHLARKLADELGE